MVLKNRQTKTTCNCNWINFCSITRSKCFFTNFLRRCTSSDSFDLKINACLHFQFKPIFPAEIVALTPISQLMTDPYLWCRPLYLERLIFFSLLSDNTLEDKARVFAVVRKNRGKLIHSQMLHRSLILIQTKILSRICCSITKSTIHRIVSRSVRNVPCHVLWRSKKSSNNEQISDVFLHTGCSFKSLLSSLKASCCGLIFLLHHRIPYSEICCNFFLWRFTNSCRSYQLFLVFLLFRHYSLV